MLKSLLYKTRQYLFARRVKAGSGHIIALHRVVEKRDENRMSWSRNREVTAAYLEETINYFLSNNYDIISLDEMRRRISNNEFHKKFVTFTFDDAYEDNFRLAYPLFKKYKLPFAIYVTGALLEMNMKCWWYNIEEVLLCYNKIILGDIELTTRTKEQEEAAFFKIRSWITHSSFESGDAFYRKIMAKYPPCNTYAQWNTMSKQQLLILNDDALVTLGAHTFNHKPFSRLQSVEAAREVEENRNYLETLLQKPVKHFSYPNGSSDIVRDKDIEIVKEAGFLTATTSRIANISGIHKNHLLALPHIPLIETPREKRIFKMILSGMLPDYLLQEKRTKV